MYVYLLAFLLHKECMLMVKTRKCRYVKKKKSIIESPRGRWYINSKEKDLYFYKLTKILVS